MGCVPLHSSPPAGIPVGTAGGAAMALTAGVVWGLLGNAIMPVEGTASLNLASLPVPFLSAVHICMDTHMLPAGEATAKGQCPHSIQHLQYLPGVIDHSFYGAHTNLLSCLTVALKGCVTGCQWMLQQTVTRTRPALHLLRCSQQVMCR